jgi:tetratricopeptide (TPR) repeat protein
MIYKHRGIAHLTLARFARAIRDFDNAVRWNTGNSRAYCNRGLAQRALGNPAIALRGFRHALDSHEVEGDARYAIAQTLAELGREREAQAECDRALALKPNHPGAKLLKECLEKVQGRCGSASR